jgi:hypothetical protein
MKKILVLIMVLLSCWQLSAQFNPGRLKFGILGGYAFYSQNDLKSLNQIISDEIPFDTQIIDDFEPVFYFGGYVQYELFNQFYLGPAYEYHYTGSRLGARDYSGMFSFDQYVRTHQLGLKADYSLFSMKRMFIAAELNLGANFTEWEMDSNLEIGENEEYSEQELEQLEGFSWYVSPTLKLGYRILSWVSLTGRVGYFFDVNQNYHYQNNKNIDVIKNPDWSGLKLSAGLEFQLR